MTPRARRIGRWLQIGALGLVAYLALPLAPFLIGAAFLLVISALVLAGHWYEKAVDVETENMSLRFAVIGLEDDVAALTQEQDALLIRLSEVLDEHALCPVPVEEIAETSKPRAKGRISRGKS